MRRIVMALAASVSAVSVAACGVIDGVGGSSGSASLKKGDAITVGLLLPEAARYDKLDYPIIKKQVLSLTHHKGKVVYANAAGDAAQQAHQLDRMIADKVDVLLVEAVDPKAIATGIRKARDAGIPVIAYDRLAQGPINAYIAFDTGFIGEMQGNALLDALGANAATSKIVMLNGPATIPDAAKFKQAALSVLSGHVNIVKSYDVEGWKPQIAKKDMEQAIQAIGVNNIAGVYASNDDVAGAAIDALKEAGVSKVPPVTGGSAELAAVHRVLSGDQLMTVYTSIPQEATDAAQMAVAKAQGRSIMFDSLTQDTADSPTEKNIPSMLVPVVELTKDHIKDTVIQDGVYTVKEICTPAYEVDCAAIGLK